ncbi:hypothetical protein RR46_04338 [Papilio xuthus]|uniref:DUF4794 domain-containing protein n=1 Tax=Papilio xuthus TaxID=66420 RepID=A0A194QJU6_PAPXU|nr:hypothetical protein RR46_04338 [Papilio xuthus]
MKSLLLLCVIAGSLERAPGALAPGQLQPPRLPPARFRSQRFELVPTTEPSAEPTTESAGGPYPASGWKPDGASLALPDERAAASGPYPPSGWSPAGKPFRLPREGPPSTRYGTPDDVYGVPDDTSAVPTTDAPATDTPEQLKIEKIEGPVEVLRSVGTYFVLLPSGQLQLVRTAGARGAAEGAGGPARLQLGRRTPLLALGR